MRMTGLLLVVMVFTLAASCSKARTNDLDPCSIQLFDGEHYRGPSVVLHGPAEYSSLDNLPGTGKDWNDEADSFMAGENTTVIMYTKTNFQGKSYTYKGKTKRPSIDEPSSLKIICE